MNLPIKNLPTAINPSSNLSAPSTFELLDADEFYNSDEVEWLVEDLIGSGTTIVLYGQPGSCKSLFVFGILHHIALGLPFFDIVPQSGEVLYIVGEGGRGLRQRGIALKKFHALGAEQFPAITFLDQSIDLLCEKQVDSLIALLEERYSPGELKIVTIDTLAQCFSGDENRADDMSKAMHSCQKIQKSIGCSVLLVHHQPKSGVGGPRGNSALAGAADTILHAKKDGKQFKISVEKQKDGDDSFVIECSMHLVEIGTRKSGKPNEVPVAEFTGLKRGEGAKIPHQQLGANQRCALEVLGNQSLTESDWQTAYFTSSPSPTRRAFREAISKLLEATLVIEKNGRYSKQ
ncbi:AAA family ATPase [Terasakiella pusilla]|uniref:AAA family ATPase n=1 Tax=Terasakiella pusilla TaxID=64973 RepID=UPI003AA914B4